MAVDLSSLDPEKLWEYSYEETEAVVDAIERKLLNTWLDADNIEAIVNSIDCIIIITLRVEEKDFQEMVGVWTQADGEPTSAYRSLQLRLKMIFINCRYFMDSAKFALEYRKKKDELESRITELQKELAKEEKQINKSLSTAKKTVNRELHKAIEEMHDSEHNYLTHVLTLMGIFSAVITVIMSLVITASSWLNNADEASAVVAFIVPNAVALCAVIVLLFLVFLYHNATTGSDEHPVKKKHAYIFLGSLFGIVVLSLISLVWSTVTHTQQCKPEHTHLIIPSAMYTIKPSVGMDQGVDEDDPIRYILFEIGGEEYYFRYDEDLVHEGNLHFCQEHKMLE